MVKKHHFMKYILFHYFKHQCYKADRRSDSWSSVEKNYRLVLKRNDAEMKITQISHRVIHQATPQML